MTTFVCEHKFIDRQFDTQSRPIENQYVVSENRNAQILIDLFEYDAKYITKKTLNIFTILCVSENNKNYNILLRTNKLQI